MLTALAILLLTQTVEPVKIAVPGLSYVGVEPAVGDVHVERFATVLGQTRGLKVTTRRDIEQILGLERQKQLLGCSDESSSCLAELAGGLGVDAVMSGILAKVGTGFTVTIRIVRASDGAVVASASERVKDEDALADWLDAEGPRLGQRIRAAFGRTDPKPSVLPYVPGIVGLVMIAGGSALAGASLSDGNALKQGTVPMADIRSTISRGQAMQNSGWGLIGVGAAAVVVSAVWVALGGSQTQPVALVPVPNGAVVSFGGSLP